MSTAVMPQFQEPVFVSSTPGRLVDLVESTSKSDNDFDLDPEAWAAFDRLCDLYGIHQSRPRIKKYSLWA